MAQLQSPSKEILKKSTKLKVKPVFKKIVDQHLCDYFGGFEKHETNKYWKVGNKVARIYYYPDPRTELFINVISRRTFESMQNENAYFVGANYHLKDENIFTVYVIHHKTIQKHYFDAEIKPRAGGNEWHIKIKHKNNNLILYRHGAEELVFPVDDNNYYIQFIMTDKEYMDLVDVLPKRQNLSNKKKANLKFVVAGDQGSVTFTDKSPIAIAILSVLTKSDNSLKLEEILSKIVNYGILTRATDKDDDVKSEIKKLVEIGAISVTKQSTYHITENIKIEVVL